MDLDVLGPCIARSLSVAIQALGIVDILARVMTEIQQHANTFLYFQRSFCQNKGQTNDKVKTETEHIVIQNIAHILANNISIVYIVIMINKVIFVMHQ